MNEENVSALMARDRAEVDVLFQEVLRALEG
jgi:hypothetical protein